MIGKFRFRGESVKQDIQTKYGYSGPLLDIYSSHKGPVIHKWHHYIPLYDRYLNQYRNTNVRILEIGVSKGGSLSMWRSYFGPKATIFGIDIDPRCAAFDGLAGNVRIGSQSDPEFLATVVNEMGGIDVVLDDGSHMMSDVRTSFEHLFPKLHTPGLYVVEDLHTAFWENYGGGMESPGNFFNLARDITDDMHGWAHNQPVRNSASKGSLSGIHVHDSFVVLEKEKVHPPTHSRVGR